MAEWLGTGLQNLLPRFNSGRRLEFSSRALSSAGERFPDTEEVTGSIPVGPTRESPQFSLGASRFWSQTWTAAVLGTEEVTGSIPVGPTPEDPRKRVGFPLCSAVESGCAGHASR